MAKLTLQQINSEIVECSKCDRLVSWREEVAKVKRASFKDQTYWGRGVGGFGDPSAKLLIVGLAPGAHGANRTGRVFTGDASGDWLYAALNRAGFANQPTSTSRDDGLELTGCYISMPVRCVPPDNKPTPAERDRCVSYLRQEIQVLQPSVVLCLGKLAFDVMQREAQVTPRAKFAHAVKVEAQLAGKAVTILGSYHVSQQNTATGKLTAHMLDDVFSKARRLLG